MGAENGTLKGTRVTLGATSCTNTVAVSLTTLGVHTKSKFSRTTKIEGSITSGNLLNKFINFFGVKVF